MKFSTALTLVAYACLATVVTSDVTDMEGAMNYLKDFCYAGPCHPDQAMRDMMETDSDMAGKMGLMAFQEYNDLPMTGELDDATMELMNFPRCGDPDLNNMEDTMSMDEMMDNMNGKRRRRRRRRFVIGSRPWSKTSLTYRITGFTPDLPQSTVRSEIARAFRVWSDVTPLRFTEVASGNADIIIFFASGSHGDGNAFDGRGGVLAHAYLPVNGGRTQIEGDSHFDEGEVWTINTNQGTNLFQVAAHEFGHALGLSHSRVQSALMAPFYRGYIPNFRLPSDDIMGIQRLYGAAPTGGDDDDDDNTGTTTTTTRRPPATPPPDMPNYCINSRIDAATLHIESNRYVLYVFQDSTFAAIDPSNGIVDGYPRSISDDWSGITGSIDASLFMQGVNQRYWSYNWRTRRYTLETRRIPAYTMLIQGGNYYLYTADRTPVTGNPRPLTRFGLPSSVRNVDAAFVWAANDKVYIMQGSNYYRLTKTYNSQILRADSGYPRPLSVWNLPVTSVSAALNYGSNNYFMSGDQIYLYNNNAIAVADGYPRNNRDVVFGCSMEIAVEMNIDTDPYTDIGEGDPEDPNTSAADVQTVSYVTFMLTNSLMVLMTLCLF